MIAYFAPLGLTELGVPSLVGCSQQESIQLKANDRMCTETTTRNFCSKTRFCWAGKGTASEGLGSGQQGDKTNLADRTIFLRTSVHGNIVRSEKSSM